MVQSNGLADRIKDFDDPVKQLSRFAVRDFVSKHSQIPTSEMSALVMPSWQGMDIRDITDPLGMQRQNVVAVEHDRGIQDAFVSESPYSAGVKTELADITDYLLVTDRKFDLIFIDWCSNMTMDVLDTLGVISGRQLLSHGGILVTNIMGERERKYASFMIDFHKRMHDSAHRSHSTHAYSFGTGGFDILDQSGLTQISRDEGITHLLNSVLFGGKANTGGVPVLMASPSYGALQNTLETMLIGLRDQFNHEGADKYFEGELRKFRNGNTTVTGLHLMHATELMMELEYLGLDSRLAFLMMSLSSGGYKPFAMERYDYESSTGSHMFMDLMKLGSLTELLRTPEYTLRVELNGNTRRFFLGNIEVNKPLDEMNPHVAEDIRTAQRRALRNLERLSELSRNQKLPERIYLGSSRRVDDSLSNSNGGLISPVHQPVTRKPKYLTDTVARALLEYGFTPNEIAGVSSKHDARHYGAIAAHWSRGTYGAPNIRTSIDLDDARLLINLGFTSGQIQQKFPEFNKESLAALQAHQTRGTYVRKK